MDPRVKERLVGATILVVLIVLIVPELLSGPKPAKVPASMPESAEPVRNVTVDLATSKATLEPDQPDLAAAAPADAASPATRAAVAAPTEAESASPATRAAVAAPTEAESASPAAVAPPAAGPAPPAANTPTAIAALHALKPAAAALENGAEIPNSPGEEAPAPSNATAGASPHWAVQVGSFASQVNADRLSRQLQAEGFATYVMAASARRGSSLYRVRVGPLPDRASAERTIARLGKVGDSASVVSP
jgi:DedD protein